jgi:hypothetical protein
VVGGNGDSHLHDYIEIMPLIQIMGNR